MLKEITLENFKGIKKADIDFGKITVLIGPNGTGKSSISHALLLLKQSINQNGLDTNGRFINLGLFEDVLNKEATNGRVGIGVSVGVSDDKIIGIPHGTLFSYKAYFNPNIINLYSEIISKNKNIM